MSDDPLSTPFAQAKNALEAERHRVFSENALGLAAPYVERPLEVVVDKDIIISRLEAEVAALKKRLSAYDPVHSTMTITATGEVTYGPEN